MAKAAIPCYSFPVPSPNSDFPRPGLTRREMLFRSAAVAGLSLGGWNLVRAAEPKKRKVLFFTKCSDYIHEAVAGKGGKQGHAQEVLAQIGPEHDLEFTFSKDGSLFSPEYCAQFDTICFYTSGDLLAKNKPKGVGNPGDGNPPLTKAGKQALLDAVAGGVGFVGIHSALDTFHTSETAATNTGQARTWRYTQWGDKLDPYLKMLGAEFIVHGMEQPARVKIVDPRFPGFENLGSSFVRQDEWYSIGNFQHDLHVLTIMETESMTRDAVKELAPSPDSWKPYVRPPYPNTWARMHGKGRVFYTAMGHGYNGEPWGNDWDFSPFRSMLLGGLSWASRNAEADITPNIEQVTPGAWTMPPVSKPVSGLPKLKHPIPNPS